VRRLVDGYGFAGQGGLVGGKPVTPDTRKRASTSAAVSAWIAGIFWSRSKYDSPHRDVIVREMLPSRLAFGQGGGSAHSLSLCLPSSLTVLAWGPFSPISSANVTCVPTARRPNAPSSTLFR
jgi:hypothetical protein